MPAVYLAWYGFLHIATPGMGKWTQGFDMFFMANFWSRSVMLWRWILIGLIGSIVIVIPSWEDDGEDFYLSDRIRNRLKTHQHGAVWIVVGVLILASIMATVQVTRVAWDNDKD